MNSPDAAPAALVYLDALGDRREVTGTDGHHLERVRRLRVGERVTGADGNGAWREYEIAETGRGAVVLVARGGVEHEPRPNPPITLAVALHKGGLEPVVSAVTELGVARVIPIRTARTVVRYDDARAKRVVEKLRVVARSAGMQSRRASLPQIDDVTDLGALAQTPDLVLADRGGAPATALAAPGAAGWTVVVGPEGGFAPEEVAALGPCPRLGLGAHVLRATTAPVAAVAVLVQHHLG